MTAIINNIIVSGNTEEIKELIDLYQNSKMAATLGDYATPIPVKDDRCDEKGGQND